MNNILTHTKQFAFHAPITSGVYAVGYDVFTFSRPRRRPECWQDEPFTLVPVSEASFKKILRTGDPYNY